MPGHCTDKMQTNKNHMALQVQQFTSSWYTYLSEKYEFVSWDDDIPKIWKVIKVMCPNHQPGFYEDEHPAIPAIPHMSR